MAENAASTAVGTGWGKYSSDVVREVTEEEVAQYREDGWVRLENLVDASTVTEMRERAQELLGADGMGHTPRPGKDYGFTWWNDYKGLAHDGIEPFRRLSLSKAIGKNVQRFLGRDVPVRFFLDEVGAKLRTVPDGPEPVTPLHQDHPYGQWDRVGSAVFWIALDDMPAERGLVRFYSGSQKEGPLGCRRPGHAGLDLLATYPFIPDRYPVSPAVGMKAGDATAHSALVLHFAPPNTTDEPRWHYLTQYFPADARWTGSEVSGGPNNGRLKDKWQLFDHPDWPVVFP